MLTDNDLINYDCAVAVCVYVRKASVNTQKDRVQRTFRLVNTQRFGEHDVTEEGKDTPPEHQHCYLEILMILRSEPLTLSSLLRDPPNCPLNAAQFSSVQSLSRVRLLATP